MVSDVLQLSGWSVSGASCSCYRSSQISFREPSDSILGIVLCQADYTAIVIGFCCFVVFVVSLVFVVLYAATACLTSCSAGSPALINYDYGKVFVLKTIIL